MCPKANLLHGTNKLIWTTLSKRLMNKTLQILGSEIDEFIPYEPKTIDILFPWDETKNP